MTRGSNFLSYLLRSDSACTVLWCNTAATGANHTGTGTSTVLAVYGRIAPGQRVPSGSYADGVLAIVAF